MQVTAEPKKGQLIEHEGQGFKTVREGRAYILVPSSARTSVDPRANAKAKAGEYPLYYRCFGCTFGSLTSYLIVSDDSHIQNVFYNPIQQFNRDLSVLAIKAYAEDACQRKRQQREVQRGKAQKKWEKKKDKKKINKNNNENENKNKRKRANGEEDECEEKFGGVKLRKTNDGLSVVAGSTASATLTVTQDADMPEASTDRNGGVAEAKQEDADDTKEALVVDSDHTQDLPDSTRNENSEVLADRHEAHQPKEWQPTFRILDALSATGLRALRYASEIPIATTIVANDRDKSAVKNINLNVQHNRLTSSIVTSAGDAQGHMYRVAFPPPDSHGPQHTSGKYDVIDLDPYGTAAPFIDAALQALEDGGLLCVTCTDSGVFASCGYSEKTFALYGGMPIKGSHSHEGGLRLILHSVATRAAAYGISIEPLLSLSIDFYVRLFIRIHKSARDVKFLAGKTMIVYGCDHGCGAWSTQFLGRHTKQSANGKEIIYKYLIGQAPSVDKHCEHCGSIMHIAGPMWGGPLHNPAFVERVLNDLENVDQEVYQTKARMEGMLTTAVDELVVNSDGLDFEAPESAQELIPKTPPESRDHHPFFFIPSALCKVIKAAAPPENLVKGALRHAGYRVTRSHCKGGSLKTDAPWSFIWEVMREWVRQRSPIKEGAVKKEMAGWKILQGMRAANEDGPERTETEDETMADAETGAGMNQQSNGTDDPDVTASAANHKEIVFDEKLGKDKPVKRLVRYQMNPRENWGPMTKAKGRA